MYSTLTLAKNGKHDGRLIGTHQKLDRVARKILMRNVPRGTKFPDIESILQFEGINGPDGLKRKSPGVDEPMHFIIPGNEDGKLMQMIKDHQFNLRKALRDGNDVRAAYEAAWMAHAITDGLTPAHHFPLVETQQELMSEKEFFKVLGVPIKGIMHGRTLPETLRNNWLYWGANGAMTKHVAFEYGVAIVMTILPERAVTPTVKRAEFKDVDLDKMFHKSLERVAALDMYDRFRKYGWTTELAIETRDVLLPEISKAIALGWASAIPKEKDTK